MRPPIVYSPAIENVQRNEDKIHEGLKRAFSHIIRATHRDLDHASRGVHAKSHALLEGTLTVHDNLPEELAQGVFANPKTYQASIRISAIPGDPLKDSVSVPRGFAVKLEGVEGEALADAGGSGVQDFLFASGPAFVAPDAKSFLRSLRLLAMTTDRFAWFKSLLSRSLRPIQALLRKMGRPVSIFDLLGGYSPTLPLGERFFSQVPLRYGRYIAKLDIVPASSSFQALKRRTLDIDKRPNAIREAIGTILAREGGSWSLRAQLCRDLKDNPIENAALPWPEHDNPYREIATISVPPQESWSSDRAESFEDTLSFAPWHGLIAHQPLGNVMRARRVLYPFAANLRSDLNKCPLFFSRKRR